MTEPGLISVVIPTYRRYAELRRAAQSAVDQTYPRVEVIVVADGPDPEARAAVADLGSRLRYFELSRNSGPAVARNFGVEQSRGEWLTFLDDDDIILPHRLTRQAAHVDAANPKRMSACRVVYCHDDREDTWPSRPIGPTEDIGDYLLVRPSLLGRPGVLSLQSLLMHHSIVRDVPLPTHADHEDWAWLLDAWHLADARVDFLWEPLAHYNIVTAGDSRSRRANWQDSLAWAMHYRPWLSRRAFNSFLSSKVALKAKRAGSWQGLRQIFHLLRHNDAQSLEWTFFLAICALPVSVAQGAWRRSLRRPAASRG